MLIGIGLVAYYNSFDGVFLLDDNPRIVNNLQIRRLWPLWEAIAQSARPVVQVSLALNYAAGGVNPWGYHAFNLGVHILAGLALFGIVRRMLDSDGLRARYGGASRWLAVAIAGIWLVHPLQTQSVTYIIQRAESLMGLFFLLTLYCGIRACQSPHPRGWSIAAVLACALGMGSKEVMVSVPVLMWLYDRVFISPTFSATFRPRWGLYAGLAATWIVLGASLASNRAEEQTFMVAGVNPWSYALTQSEVIVHYLRLAVWPYPLVLDYAWQIAEPLSSVVPSAALVLALLAGTVLALLKRVWVGFWGAWFFVILAPTSSIMPIADVAFEHRMYLPLAAVVAVVVIGGHDLLAVLGRRLRVAVDARRWLEAGLAVAAVAALGGATVSRNEDYRSDDAMWSDVVAKRPDNPRAHNNLGVALSKQGNTGEAIAHYQEAVRLKPDYVDAQNNLGSALFKQGRIDEAAVHFAEAVRVRPIFADAQNNLGSALVKQGRIDEAIAHFREALRLRPGFAEAQSNLGSALAKQGRNDEAATHFSRAAGLKPDSAHAHNDLGNALYLKGRIKEAVAEYSKAVRLDPGLAEAHHNLGLAVLEQGDAQGAIVHFSEAVRLKPDYAKAHNNLGSLLYQQGQVKEAIDHFAEAVRLDPSFSDARNNLRAAQAGPRLVKIKPP